MDFVAGLVVGMLVMFFLSSLLGGDSRPPETTGDDFEDETLP